MEQHKREKHRLWKSKPSHHEKMVDVDQPKITTEHFPYMVKKDILSHSNLSSKLPL